MFLGVEFCPAIDASGQGFLKLAGRSSDSSEYRTDVAGTADQPQEEITRDMCFALRQSCPSCSYPASDSVKLFSVRQLLWDVSVLECENCGLAYKDSIPQDWLLEHIYGGNYTHFAALKGAESPRVDYRSRVERLGQPRGRHLDYGCGAGQFVESALRAGWDSYGADPFLPDTAFVPALSGRLFKGNAANLLSVPSIDRFDCISMWAVAEHLTLFYDTFVGLRRLLNPGGMIIFNSPNAHSLIARRSGSSWRMATLIEHVQFCTPSSVIWLAKSLGLRLHSLRIAGSPYPLGRSEGGCSGQGLHGLPIQPRTISRDDGQLPAAISVSRRPLTRWTGPLYELFFGKDGSSWAAQLIRRLIHATRLGDHIEVTLLAP